MPTTRVMAMATCTATRMPSRSLRPRAWPTRTVAARAKLSGTMKIREVKLRAIWWLATTWAPRLPISRAMTAKMLTSKKIVSPTGKPRRSM